MGDRAIAAVSETLREIVTQALLDDPKLLEGKEHVVLASPADMPHDRYTRLGIFLYRVVEHPLSRPEAMQIRGPLGFSLSYLIVPVGPDPIHCQHILGRVLRTLYENAKLRVPEAGETVDLTLIRHPLEQSLQLWSALDTPYTCAIYCDVRIVQLMEQQ